MSVQSSGLSINLVTKSGSNVFKGTALATFENDAMQGGNVTREMFYSGTSGLLSGNPIKKHLELLGGVRRPDQAQPAVVVGGGRQAGHQYRRHQLLRSGRRRLL